MSTPSELLEAADLVLEATEQPEEFKSRLRALIRNAGDGMVEDHDVAGLVAIVDVDSDTGA
ncbi:hypothetical protein ACLBYG_25290 [Methylobacterium sp. D53M]